MCILNLQRCFNLAVQSIKSIKIQNYRKRVRFSFSPFRFSDLSFAKNISKIQSIQSNIFRILFIRADCQSKKTIDEELVWFIQFNYFDEICRWQFVQVITIIDFESSGNQLISSWKEFELVFVWLRFQNQNRKIRVLPRVEHSTLINNYWKIDKIIAVDQNVDIWSAQWWTITRISNPKLFLMFLVCNVFNNAIRLKSKVTLKV